MCVLALVAVVFAIINLVEEPSYEMLVADFTIYGIFVLDYFWGLWRAPNKKVFVKEHFWDLVAIIPFDSSLRAARFLGLMRVEGSLRRR